MAQLAASPALGAKSEQPDMGGGGGPREGAEQGADDGLHALDAALLALSHRIPLEVHCPSGWLHCLHPKCAPPLQQACSAFIATPAPPMNVQHKDTAHSVPTRSAARTFIIQAPLLASLPTHRQKHS